VPYSKPIAPSSVTIVSSSVTIVPSSVTIVPSSVTIVSYSKAIVPSSKAIVPCSWPFNNARFYPFSTIKKWHYTVNQKFTKLSTQYFRLYKCKVFCYFMLFNSDIMAIIKGFLIYMNRKYKYTVQTFNVGASNTYIYTVAVTNPRGDTRQINWDFRKSGIEKVIIDYINSQIQKYEPITFQFPKREKPRRE